MVQASAAVNSVVKDRASFVEYIAFVLGDDYVASMLEGKQMGESGFFANSSDAMPALYASLRFLWRVLFPRCLSIDELSQVYTFLTACAVYPRGRKSA